MTGVTRAASVLAGATLAVGLLAAPVAADPPVAPISGLVGGLLSPAAAPGPRASEPVRVDPADLGRVWAPDRRLRRGCADYPYRYQLTTPTEDWTLQVFLKDRDGRALSSGTFSSDSDPSTHRPKFRFCRWSTRAGWFTIRSHVHWYDDDGTEHDAWLPPSRFRLRPPPPL